MMHVDDEDINPPKVSNAPSDGLKDAIEMAAKMRDVFRETINKAFGKEIWAEDKQITDAAHDLLAACKEAAKYLCCDDRYADAASDCLEQVERAIAKAEGPETGEKS
tara:strand:- start:5087 stop:5407 length:321 start_codon:yes stop_codon:yes gene_type:complete